MFYEVKNNKLVRPLPGYFDGFKEDLKDVDPSLLNEMQTEYMSIENIQEVSEEEHKLFQLKEFKKQEIKQYFDNSIQNGYFFSETFQMEVDCRRGGKDNDKQNVEGLLDRFDELDPEEKYYKGVTETDTEEFTIPQLQALKLEMTRHVHSLYKKKWVVEQQIEQATTLEELEGIVWT